jgi:hypothetical protein
MFLKSVAYTLFMKVLFISIPDSTESENDLVLTGQGREQAQKLADALKKYEISKVFLASTAAALQAFMPYKKANPEIKYTISERLREVSPDLLVKEVDDDVPSKERSDKNRAELFLKELVMQNDSSYNAVFLNPNLMKYYLAKVDKRIKRKKILPGSVFEVDFASMKLTQPKV